MRFYSVISKKYVVSCSDWIVQKIISSCNLEKLKTESENICNNLDKENKDYFYKVEYIDEFLDLDYK